MLSEEKAKTLREMDRLYDLYMSSGISEAGFSRKHGPLEERFGQIQHTLQQLQSEIDFLKIQNISSDHILSDSQDLTSRRPNSSHENKRQLLESITNHIVTHEDEVAITLNYYPYFK